MGTPKSLIFMSLYSEAGLICSRSFLVGFLVCFIFLRVCPRPRSLHQSRQGRVTSQRLGGVDTLAVELGTLSPRN